MSCFHWRDKLSVILDTSIRKATHGKFEIMAENQQPTFDTCRSQSYKRPFDESGLGSNSGDSIEDGPIGIKRVRNPDIDRSFRSVLDHLLSSILRGKMLIHSRYFQVTIRITG